MIHSLLRRRKLPPFHLDKRLLLLLLLLLRRLLRLLAPHTRPPKRKLAVHRRLFIIPFFRRTPRRRFLSTNTKPFLARPIASMNLFLLFWRSMCSVELVEQATGVTQWRLTVGPFTPENSRIGVAIGAREVSVCCYWTGTERLSEM